MGGVGLNEEGHFYLDEGGREYVGRPSAEIDEAWEDLLGGLAPEKTKLPCNIADEIQD